jgi:hypothetical protein
MIDVMTLRSRALLAVALTIGFYALALSLIAILIAVLFIPHVPIRLVLFCVIGAAVIAISIVPWPRKFVPPGPMRSFKVWRMRSVRRCRPMCT